MVKTTTSAIVVGLLCKTKTNVQRKNPALAHLLSNELNILVVVVSPAITFPFCVSDSQQKNKIQFLIINSYFVIMVRMIVRPVLLLDL